MLWAMNDLPALPLEAKGDRGAVYRRLRVLSLVTIPQGQRDGKLKHLFKNSSEARQALFAVFVGASKKQTEPPGDTPNVARARKMLREDSFGDVGAWIESILVEEPLGAVTTAALYEAAAVACGEDGAVPGFTKTRLTQAVRRHYSLEVPAGFGGGTRGWRGWRMRLPGEIEAESSTEICDVPCIDGRPCAERIVDGRCPQEEYHTCPRCAAPRADCRCDPKGGAGATPADGGAQTSLTGALDGRISHWACTRSQLRAGPGQDLIFTVFADNVHRGLLELRAAGPELYLGPEDVAARGGAEKILDLFEDSLWNARTTDWHQTLRAYKVKTSDPRWKRVARRFPAFARILGVTV